MTLGPHLVSLYGLQHSAYVRFSVLALSSIFFLVDPFAALPTFLAITEGSDAARRRRIARKGALTTLIVLAAFAFAGEAIFRVLGITLPAFEIAGGVILMLIGLDMLQARRSATQEVAGDTAAAAQKEDAGIVPLGVPMLAGPGAITSVMVLVGQAQTLWQMAAILISIAITAAACYLILGHSNKVVRLLGETGIRILVRIMWPASGGAGRAVLRQRPRRPRRHRPPTRVAPRLKFLETNQSFRAVASGGRLEAQRTQPVPRSSGTTARPFAACDCGNDTLPMKSPEASQGNRREHPGSSRLFFWIGRNLIPSLH